MFGIFEAITDFFSTIFGVIEFIFKGIGMLISLLTTGMEFLISMLSYLPTPFIVGGVALVVICVLYKVLGRENQS